MLTGTMAWTPGVHDPTLGAWLVTVGYLAAALMCLRAWRRMRETGRSTATAWLVLATVLLVLGLNKQLDLQNLMIDVGRDLAREQGWYQQRRMVLAVFLLVGAGGVAVLSMLVLKRFSGSHWAPSVAVAGTGLLVVMLFLQGISYRHLSTVLNWNLLPGRSDALGVHVEEMLELVFLGVIAWAAGRTRESADVPAPRS